MTFPTRLLETRHKLWVAGSTFQSLDKPGKMAGFSPPGSPMIRGGWNSTGWFMGHFHRPTSTTLLKQQKRLSNGMV
jgi:hypothetical protein